MSLDINRIKQLNFASDQYFQEALPKAQIFLHHTAGGASALNTANGWKSDSSRVATPYVLTGKINSPYEKDGDIIQCFNEKYWGYHLGIKAEAFTSFGLSYTRLDKTSIAIEVCNWGQLTKQSDGTYINYLNHTVSADEVTELETPFKGYKYFHKYTDAQIASLKELVEYLANKFNIDKTYNPDIFDITERAFKGENGIFTHNSVRTDKWDMYPCPRLIEMLKSL